MLEIITGALWGVTLALWLPLLWSLAFDLASRIDQWHAERYRWHREWDAPWESLTPAERNRLTERCATVSNAFRSAGVSCEALAATLKRT